MMKPALLQNFLAGSARVLDAQGDFASSVATVQHFALRLRHEPSESHIELVIHCDFLSCHSAGGGSRPRSFLHLTLSHGCNRLQPEWL